MRNLKAIYPRLLVVFLTAVCPLVAQADFKYSIAEDDDGQVWFDRVKKIIGEQKINSIEQLLPRLPESLRSRHVLAFKSMSLQDADYLRPRVLLISPAAKFILTFNGEADQNGFEAIETMRFTTKAGKPEFIFEEIVFSGDLATRKKYLLAKKNAQALLDLADHKSRTGPNPETCLTCHRSNPRPNWEHYSFWPGFYGQDDDRPLTDTAYEADPTSGKDLMFDNSEAAKNLLRFIKAAKQHRRYRFLIGLEQHSILATGYMTKSNSERSLAMPLSALTRDLVHLNSLRVAHALSETKQPKLNAMKMLHVIWQCYDNVQIEGVRGISQYSDYLALAQEFKNSDVEWQDFFMNFYPGPGNMFRSPINGAGSLTFAIVQRDPSLQKYFHNEGHYKGILFRRSSAPLKDSTYRTQFCLDIEEDMANLWAAENQN